MPLNLCTCCRSSRTTLLFALTSTESGGGGDFQDQIALRNPDAGAFEPHESLGARLSERHTVEVVGYEEATGKPYVLTDRRSDRVQAWAYDPATRRFDDEPLVAHPALPVGTLILGRHEADLRRILEFEIDAVTREAIHIDPLLRSIQAGLRKTAILAGVGQIYFGDRGSVFSRP
jgi:hypothetical protein